VKLLRARWGDETGGWADEAIWSFGEDGRKRSGALMTPDQTTGCDHVGHHSQRNLPPVPSGRRSRYFEPGGKAMIEAITAICIFFSISVFLAHAFDVYRMR
jgi:hypothetical protein